MFCYPGYQPLVVRFFFRPPTGSCRPGLEIVAEAAPSAAAAGVVGAAAASVRWVGHPKPHWELGVGQLPLGWISPGLTFQIMIYRIC